MTGLYQHSGLSEQHWLVRVNLYTLEDYYRVVSNPSLYDKVACAGQDSKCPVATHDYMSQSRPYLVIAWDI
jgi:hypothetical protein